MTTGYLQRRHLTLSTVPDTDRAAHEVPLHLSSGFGAHLRTFLQKRPFSQQRMAADLGVDRTLMDDLEQGQRTISLPLLEILAFGLNLSLPELLQQL